MAQYAHKGKHPNERLPTKWVEGLDKALFETPYTDNDCGQQIWGGWNVEGQREWAILKKEIKVAKAKVIEIQEDDKTFTITKFDHVEDIFLKLLTSTEQGKKGPAKAAKAKAPSERELFDPNADSDEEVENGAGAVADVAKGNVKKPKAKTAAVAAKRSSDRVKAADKTGPSKKAKNKK